MNIQVLDEEILNVIEPKQLEWYVLSKKWQKTKNTEQDTISIWKKENLEPETVSSGTSSVLRIPLSRDADDYYNEIVKALKKLEEIEKRSSVDILRDIMYINANIIEIKLDYSKVISIGETSDLFTKIKELLLEIIKTSQKSEELDQPEKSSSDSVDAWLDRIKIDVIKINKKSVFSFIEEVIPMDKIPDPSQYNESILPQAPDTLTFDPLEKIARFLTAIKPQEAPCSFQEISQKLDSITDLKSYGLNLDKCSILIIHSPFGRTQSKVK